MTAIDEGKSPKAAIDDLIEHGVKRESIASAVTERFKPIYTTLYQSDRKASIDLKAQLVNTYALLGYDRQKKADDIAKWLKTK